MKIQTLHNSKIDKIKWDQCLIESEHAFIYANSWYLDIVCPDWHGIILNDYEAIMPVPYKRKYGLPLCLQPTFTQQFGVFSKKTLSEKELEKIIDNYNEIWFLKRDIQLYHLLPVVLKKTKEYERDNVELNLNKTSDLLTKSYSENTKRNIKKAHTMGISFEETFESKEIIDHFNATKEITINEKNLINLIQAPQNQVTMYKVSDKEREYLCGIIFFFFKNRYYYIFSSTSEKGRNSGAPQALIDFFIQKHAEKNVILDFEGSDNENLARFYTGFGGEIKHYYRYKGWGL